MKDLTVIIPVEKMDDERKAMFKTAYESIEPETPVIVVGPKEEIEKLKDEYPGVKLLENEDINLPQQVNTAVNAVETKYFSVLEYDDAFTSNWFKNLRERMDAYPDLFVYLPICEVFSHDKPDAIIGYMNEPVWASSFSEKLGYFDTESLNNYININCTGGVFDKEKFLEIGGLKESMKLSFWYEMILRANYKCKEIYVIPKIGYRHRINRPESLMDVYSKTMEPKEADWWIALAKEEQYFKRDRNKQYKK